MGFEVVGQLTHQHQVILAPPGKAGIEIGPFKWLTTLLGSVKTSLAGTHHAFKFRKYGHRYLAEVQYRFNRRANLADIIPQLLKAAIHVNLCPQWKIQNPAEMGT